jgi:bacillithiol system protein YtxJ
LDAGARPQRSLPEKNLFLPRNLPRPRRELQNSSAYKSEVIVKRNVNHLHSIEELSQVLEESKRRPILIFKHSTTCPISTRAFRELQKYLEDADPEVGYHMITVQTDRPVSNEVASRLRIQHETPQAILVKDGERVWDASHFSIRASALEEAIQKGRQY